MAPVYTKETSENEDSSKLFIIFLTFHFKDLFKKKRYIKTKYVFFSTNGCIFFKDSSVDLEPRRKKKRTSRWVTTEKDPKSFIPGMPTIIPPNMTKEQEKAYLSKCLTLYSFFLFVYILIFSHEKKNYAFKSK